MFNNRENARLALRTWLFGALGRNSWLPSRIREKFERVSVAQRDLLFRNADAWQQDCTVVAPLPHHFVCHDCEQREQDIPTIESSIPTVLSSDPVFYQKDLIRQIGGIDIPLESDLDPRDWVQRILVICPVPITINHAGGLRQIDILHRIKRHNPRIYIELFTAINVGDCGPVDTVTQIVDKVIVSPHHDFSISEYIRIVSTPKYFDIIDFQFAQTPQIVEAYRCIGERLLFTPMESHVRNEMIARSLTTITSSDLQTFEAQTEQRICEIVDCVVCVSEPDRQAVAAVTSTEVIAIETGVSDIEFSATIAAVNPDDRAVCYVAYFGSQTNRDALEWYLNEVHPRVYHSVPDYLFRIVGAGDLGDINNNLPPGVQYIGEVDRVGPHIKASAIGIAPALSGSGFRGKINQYAHLGVPTVATSIAADGLAYKPGESILVADDPNDFADYIISLLKEADQRHHIATAASRLCKEVYGWDHKFPLIAKVYELGSAADEISLPSVHAVVPSYMHAAFIEARIRSIYAQQYKNMRVTVIDDNSTDESHDIILRLQREFGFVYIRRSVNSGTPFSSWRYAAENTPEDIIWICESDDVADPMLLPTLVRQMTASKGVVVSYCCSSVVDERGEKIDDTTSYFREVFHPTRWQAPFIARGQHELKQYLRFGMVVPNMSSALISTEVFRKALTSDVQRYKLAGDWLFIGQAVQYGDIAYTPEALNQFRRHPQTSRNLTSEARRLAEHVSVRLRLSGLAGADYSETVSAVRYDLPEIAGNPELSAAAAWEFAKLDPSREAQWHSLRMASAEAI